MQTASWRDAYADVLPSEYLAGQLAVDLERHWRAAAIQPGDVVLVAEEEGLIGFIAVWCRPDPFIDSLHVQLARRSQGVGARLMMSAARRLMRQGHRTAHLWAVAANERAIRFYERLGGVRADRAMKDLFGHEVLNVKIEWSDIAVLDTGD